MEEKVQFDFVSAEVLRRRKWMMLALAVAGLAIGVVVSSKEDNWWILLFTFGWMAWLGAFAFRFHRLELLMRIPAVASQIDQFRRLRSGDFADVCSELAREGRLMEHKEVVMGLPATWGKKQGLSHFDCGLFEVSVFEKNGRVGDLRVFVKNLRGAAL